MQVNLQLYRSFLTKRFYYTRVFLLGRKNSLDELGTIRSSSLKRASLAFTTVFSSAEKILPDQSNPDISQEKNNLPVEHGAKKVVKELSGQHLNTWVKKNTSKILTAILSLSFFITAALFFPDIYYRLSPPDTVVIEAKESGTAQGGGFDEVIEELSPGRAYAPPVDESLPEGDWLVIPRIGVRTELRETTDPEEALSQGVWHVPEWGEAGDIEEPMIVAAHRFGWDWWWQSDYWKYNSFYLLPDTEPGDRIEVISGQRKWVYEIYSGEEGDEILDYDADMILYTCKFLNSPVRHFRYARLIDPTIDTQG